MYHPAAPSPDSPYDQDEFEFLELQNVGSEPLDLSEIQIRGGVEFDFAASEVEVLDPGEFVLVLENFEAFSSRYDVAGLNIAGEYGGKLSNSGEALIVEGYLGEPILEFEFSDEWHSSTDGDGNSLVVVDAGALRESWNDPTNWRASLEVGGSPGTGGSGPIDPGGLQRPGDASQDGRWNVSDAALLLQGLFGGRSTTPCDGETIASGGNRVLFDLDGNGSVALTDAVLLLNFMFRRGVPPALGDGCVRIKGCPDSCVD